MNGEDVKLSFAETCQPDLVLVWKSWRGEESTQASDYRVITVNFDQKLLIRKSWIVEKK